MPWPGTDLKAERLNTSPSSSQKTSFATAFLPPPTIRCYTSGTTCSGSILPFNHNRLVDGVPHVHNVVRSQFIIAATGQPPPTYDIALSCSGHENDQRSTDTDGYRDKDSNGNDAGDNDDGPAQGTWTIVNEIVDGACLLRCITGKILGNPTMHSTARTQLTQHVSEHVHDRTPGSGGNTLCASFFVRIHIELVRSGGRPDQTYNSVPHYLRLTTSHPASHECHLH